MSTNRPRRFGKSIFLSMLRYYYDINERENFAELFKGLWIADHPTPGQGKYQVMHLDFSQIGGSIDELEERFNGYMYVKFRSFAQQYARYYPEGYLAELDKYTSASDIMNYVHNAARLNGSSLYLIVDMDDLTSGYNIATSLTMKPQFNLMIGFSEEDVREMIRYY